jgi:azurin
MFLPLVMSLALMSSPAAGSSSESSQNKPAPAGAQTKPAPAGPQTKPGATASSVRTVELAGSDDMKYSVTSIPAKPGETLRIRLTSKGTLPKIAMAHNVVVLKLGAKQMEFANAAAMARATDFIPPDMKDQVLAATTLAGPGETVEVTFKVPTAPGSYPYICTFPGHFAAGMKGTLVVK